MEYWQDVTIRPAASPVVEIAPDGSAYLVFPGNITLILSLDELRELLASAMIAVASEPANANVA